MMVETLLIAIIPAAIIILGGMMILRKGSEHTSGQRFLFYLLIIGVTLMLVVCVTEQISPEYDTRLTNQISILTTPIVIGVLTLILINFKRLLVFKPGEKVLAALLGLVLVSLIAGSVWGESFSTAQMILSSTLFLASIWVFIGKFDALGVALSILVLILLALFNANLLDDLSMLPSWAQYPFGFLMFSLPGMAIALAAVWITNGLKTFSYPKEIQYLGKTNTHWLPIILRFGLAAILLGYLAYTVLWASIWDQTSDGLGGVMFAMWASLAAIAAGMVMGINAPKWYRSAGLVFSALVPVLMFGAFRYGWDVSYHAITEGRASRIQHAIESYYEENERYPKELGELIPNHLLWIPEPVILRGEDWCYQGDRDYYRLGTFKREFFSTPLSLHIYASAGGVPETGWSCEERLPEMKARYDLPYLHEHETIRPTAEPLPTSSLPIQRTPIQPLLSSKFITLGSWSLDGKYLLFSQLETSDGKPVKKLNFLDAETGEICQTEEEYPLESNLREKHVWLSEERLLLLLEGGEINLVKPCMADTESLTDRFPERFTQVAAYDRNGDRILFKNQDSFWIMDGNSLDIWLIPNVSPNPYELHWDRYAWSPDGERLAISRLNGRDREAGSTLYLIVGDTGEVTGVQPMEYASDQSAPSVDWLTNDELLLHGSGILATVDYFIEPPRITNVMRDIFDLDFDYPNDIASMGFVTDPIKEEYYIALWVNRPGNRDVYLYHSESDSVEVHHPVANLLLFFPGGEWTVLTNIDLDIPEQDEFELIWVDKPGTEPQRIIVQGHIPRNYPSLFPRFLPHGSQLVFSSSQGISLVSIPDGEIIKFWELSNGKGNLDIYLVVSPNEEALIAIVDGVKLYHIPLKRK
jgi:hypothetical protein